jgi:AmiR/NasT family two-component response regulator
MMSQDYESSALELAVERLVAVTGAGMERQSQLLQALQTRIVIEQAKGVLAERHTLDMNSAFDVLRGAARHHGLNLHTLASEVIFSRETPAPIVALLERQASPTHTQEL